MKLFIADFQKSGFSIQWQAGLQEIRSGQVWRLVAPIFIHLGLMHIFFNMFWLRDLGSMIEARQGSLWLAVLVTALGVVSNLAQYLVSGPDFGGMSGVVYGLVGYIWMRGKYDPASGLVLHPATLLMMVIWFFVCLAGLFGSVANMAHFAGLVMGIAWGYLSSRPFR
jgi:membrane associated rhomboid family serine protease